MPSTSSNDPGKTYTLDDFIRLKTSDNMTYTNFAIMQRSITHNELIYAIDNVIYTYLPELKAIKKVVELTEEEKIKYIYKPKLLAYNIYGATETYFVLMALNGLHNMKDFDLNGNWFYAIRPRELYSYLNNIYSGEREYIEVNRDNMGIITY